MSLFKKMVLYAAACMLLLHNLVPHQHHGEMASYVHEGQHHSRGLLDLLGTVFHESAVDVEKINEEEATPQVQQISLKKIDEAKDKAEQGRFWSLYMLWRRWYEAAAYFGELRELSVWLAVRACWREMRPDLAEKIFSIVGFRAPPAIA